MCVKIFHFKCAHIGQPVSEIFVFLTTYIHNYYALNKILNSDWLNTNLTLVDVWLEGSNVRQRNLMSG